MIVWQDNKASDRNHTLRIIKGDTQRFILKKWSQYILSLAEDDKISLKYALHDVLHENIYSDVASKKPSKATASKYTISYKNKYFKKSNLFQVILKQIRL